MNTIEQIKTEVERRIKENESWKDFHRSKGTTTNFDDVKIIELQSLLSFLSTLESEKPMKQEELEEEYKDYVVNDPVYSKLVNRNAGLVIARHFAQWQKEQDEISKVNYEGARVVYDNTVQHLQEKIDEKYELGKKDMKEQMLKEAVEGVLVDNVDGTQEICLHGNRYGEKVRIIIVKENEK